MRKENTKKTMANLAPDDRGVKKKTNNATVASMPLEVGAYLHLGPFTPASKRTLSTITYVFGSCVCTCVAGWGEQEAICPSIPEYSEG